jgi:peroxiredoxin Q/BCP
MSTVEQGDPAPAFELPDETGRMHGLEARRGAWTVVYFYPEDDTPGCTTEACQFRDAHGDITGEGAEVWGISPDGAASHTRFRAKFGLPFTLLSDPDHAVASTYGVWGPKTRDGRTYDGIIRSTFLIDPEGRVARAWRNVKADGHAGAVLETLRELRTSGGPGGEGDGAA